MITARHAAWALPLAGVTLVAGAILCSGKLMAQTDTDDDPNVPTLSQAPPRGRVLDPDGNPVPGARVLLYHAVSYWGLGSRVEEEVVTGANGGFAFSKPLRFKNPAARRSSADYTLFALAPGRAPGWAAIWPENPGDNAYDLTLTAPKPQTYEVEDKEGRPIEGAVVWLRYAGKQTDRRPFFPEDFLVPEDLGVCRALTDAAGRATLDNLPDTVVSVAAAKLGFEDESNCTTPRDGVPRFTLRPAGVLEGRVTDPLGQPVAGATVALYPKFRYHQFFLAKTDAEGRYRVGKIWSDREVRADRPDWGKYEVSLSHPRFKTAKREVAFTTGQTITGFDLAAVPGTEVEGRLLDPVTRAPVVGGEVFVDSPSGRQTRHTDSQGGFRCRIVPGEIYVAFTTPPRGSYVVESDRFNGPPTHLRTTVGGERFAVELFLPGPLGRLGTVRGRMETPGGQPVPLSPVVPVIAAPRLQLAGWTSEPLRGGRTDEAGRFELRGMPVGLAFTLSGQTPDGQLRGTLAGRLDEDVLELPVPLTLQATVSAEALLTDLAGRPRADLAVQVTPVVAGKNVWTQRQDLRTGRDGVLRVPGATPGGAYVVSVPTNSMTEPSYEEATFTAPPLSDAPPGPRLALVLSAQYLVRLLGPDGQPVPIKEFRDFRVELHREKGVVQWINGPLAVAGRAGADVIVARRTLSLGKGGDIIRFLIETEAGNVVRAEGPIATDGSGRIVVHTTEAAPTDTAPDSGIVDVGTEEIVGRVLGPDGEAISGVRAAFPVRPWNPSDARQALSGPDGVFRLPMRPADRYACLTLFKEGWAPVFLTEVPVGRGFRVILQNTTRLRGTVGGESPGRVELLLEKSKLTPQADRIDQRTQEVQFRTPTDEQGAYDFPMEPGKYRWSATDRDGRFARGEIDLGAGETRDLGASLRRGHDVVLELRDCQTDQPVVGVEVCLMERSPGSIANRPGTERTSDADGRLRWENLPPGKTWFGALGMQPSLLLRGARQDRYARWWRDEREPGHPDPGGLRTGRDGVGELIVNVGEGTPDPVRVQLERGVKVSGVVVGADDKGLAGVEVALVSDHGGISGDGRFTTQTGADGDFLAYLPAGSGLTYHLCAHFQPWTEHVAAANAISERFNSKPGDERTFRLRMSEGGWLTGRLVTAGGTEPAGGFKVTANAADGLDSAYASCIATAGADGRFRLGPLRPGKYEVHAGTGPGAPLGELAGGKKIPAEAADGETRDLGDLPLPAGAKLKE